MRVSSETIVKLIARCNEIFKESDEGYSMTGLMVANKKLEFKIWQWSNDHQIGIASGFKDNLNSSIDNEAKLICKYVTKEIFEYMNPQLKQKQEASIGLRQLAALASILQI